MGEQIKSVLIGCDHAAFGLKEKIKLYLNENKIDVEDVGTFGSDSVDYPDFAARVASPVSKGDYNRGILMCASGIGMSIVANRYVGVRAALCNDLFSATLSRQHNDANILVMGSRIIGEGLARAIVHTWLKTPFNEGRHRRRIEKIDLITKTSIEDLPL